MTEDMRPRWTTLRALWNLRDDRTLTASEQRALWALLAFANGRGKCSPSVRTLAVCCRMRPQTVRAVVRQLERRPGPIAVAVTRRRSASGDADTHVYQLSPGEGWIDYRDSEGRVDPDGTVPVDGTVDPDATVPSRSTEGTVDPDTTVPSRSTKGTVRIDPVRGSKEESEEGESAYAPAHSPSADAHQTKETKPWRRVPASWTPTDEHRALANKLGVDFDTELANLRDYEFAAPKRDADAVFRKWLRNARPRTQSREREIPPEIHTYVMPDGRKVRA